MQNFYVNIRKYPVLQSYKSINLKKSKVIKQTQFRDSFYYLNKIFFNMMMNDYFS